ncbi:lysylphosphatidylglycerol synthase transmembrane domain-containing protein [Echinicola jeungdonensis]|uniref:Lysylphosphatidylglycerol synthase transmembrane domain-containing protein n=1 Tax=Echinicola jeungdonensis TaxID=709343 RepID=A0ABV5J3S3_9BACT|nr:lysylphosphatidylglycerol synthase transmembrane domain-containing protein [Echinicola jeungdonensis]MDN3669022.1 lysylphosphatidylglycerol synthase transmembrane domain-containing protein [Echinicola jeungdonensis]
MRLSTKQWIQVGISLVVAIWIFWFLYKDVKMESLLEALQQASLFWIFMSVFISVLGYGLRAWRWKLLIEGDVGKKVKSSHSFWALMVGYLVNLLVPRAGEVARCGVLKRTDNLQVSKLLGTVILERMIDLLFLLGVMVLAFVVEHEVFVQLAGDLVSLETLAVSLKSYMPLLLGGVILIGIILNWVRKRYRDHGLVQKFQHFMREFFQGMKSLRQVTHPKSFWMASTCIWIIYFLMMYFVAIAIPSTANLSPSAVLMVMVMGSIGMIAPVQGGIGTFHALVAFILMTYGLTEEEGKIIAVIIHSSQVLTVLLLGALGLFMVAKITLVAKLKPEKLRSK